MEKNKKSYYETTTFEVEILDGTVRFPLFESAERRKWRKPKTVSEMAHARRAVASVLTRTLYSSRSRLLLPPLLNSLQSQPDPFRLPTRFKNSGPGYSPLNDPSPNWSNRPPKETILLDGCDYEHWLIVMEFSTDPKPSEQEMIDAYVKTLATVLGR